MILAKWQSPLPSYLILVGDASYDFKGYVFKSKGVKLSTNYIPSYGIPVSDNWYVYSIKMFCLFRR